MSNIILVIMGILMAGACALMVLYFGGNAWEKNYVEAEAGRLVQEGAQVEGAMELYLHQEGRYPEGEEPLQTLIDDQYLKERPIGMVKNEIRGKWTIDYDAGYIRSGIGDADDEDALEICRTARMRLDFPEPDNIYKCDGSDHPDGRLSPRDPCCITG